MGAFALESPVVQEELLSFLVFCFQEAIFCELVSEGNSNRAERANHS